ncbi:hypothetical protein F4779DRAFT_630486 [Xylariaceae sp. FL0662B]|nr:hypothetical protein F4779DRAFT_630486 [Xylariaceae sp. FL0662B]
MEITNTPDPLRQLGAATQTAIADLNPDLPELTSRVVRGVVTITWPYNSVKNTFAFILAEPDFRLRRNKGQVRIDFEGSSARAAGESGLSSGDEVLVGLDGATWETEQTKKRQSLPGAGVDWKLKFAEKLLLQVTLGETGETRLIAVDHPLPLERQKSIEAPSTKITQVQDSLPSSPPAPKLLRNAGAARLNDGEYESPAFIKRARVSYGSLFEDGYDIFEEDGGVKGGGRKRTRFGRNSGAWRYSSQSPSPEPAVSSHSDIAGQDEEHASSPPRPEMADEGCQTMELDVPIPSPVQASVNSTTAQKSPESPSAEERVDRPRGIMVDQGVQGYPQSEWPNSISTSHLPFVPTSLFPSNSSGLPAFQSDPGLQQEWGHRNTDFAPETHPENAPSLSYSTAPPLSNDFTAGHGSQHAVGFGGIRPPSRGRSPSEPNNPAVEDVEHDDDMHHGLPVNEETYPIHSPKPTMAYPPLDLQEEERTRPALQEPLHDYPQSYLDESQDYSHEVLDSEQNQFSQDARPPSWATINNNSQAASMPRTDGLGSTGGTTPDDAVVIDESDSEEEPAPAPAAVEDTIIDGRADNLEAYEDAEVEDEVDAEYSDDDEPEYDADEIGGDYDTRNYIGPDDDDDDSHDEDLRPYDPEPKFNDGEIWDEEDENEENAEYASEYDTDNTSDAENDLPQPPSQPSTQVIDLISSSEDEEDEEEEEEETTMPQLPSRPAPNSVSHKQIQMATEDMPSQSMEAGHSSDNKEYEEIHDELEEQEVETEQGEEDRSGREFARSGSAVSSVENEDAKALEEEQEEAEGPPENETKGEIHLDIDPQHESSNPAYPEPNGFSEDQRSSPNLGLSDSLTTKDKGEDDDMRDIEEEPEVVVPQSAADGLEILSRAIENETNTKDQLVTLKEVPDEMIIDNTLPERNELAAANAEMLEITSAVRAEDESQEAEDNEPGGMVPAMLSAASETQPPFVGESRNVEVIAPSSPPLTHSFKSQPAREEHVDAELEETTNITESQEPADQLPTPLDSQVLGTSITLDSVAALPTEVEADEEVQHISEPRDVIVEEVSTTVKSLADTRKPTEFVEIVAQSVEADANGTISTEQGLSIVGKEEEITKSIEVGITDTSDAEPEQPAVMEEIGETLEPDRLTASPSSSFETQFGDEISQDDVLESTFKSVTSSSAQPQLEADVDASGISLSFRSQMEGDEELQASILEYSQDLDDELDPANMDELSERESRDQSEDDRDEVILVEDGGQADVESEPQDALTAALSVDLEIQKQLQDTQQAAAIRALPQSDVMQQEALTDPSVQLARAANASRRVSRQRDAAADIVRPHTQLAGLRKSLSFTSEVEDSSVLLARASLNGAPQTEADSPSMTAAKLKLARYLRDELPDCTPLKLLRHYLQRKLDVIAVVAMQPPEPQRAKGGPREYMMSFTITDYSVGPYSVAEVQFYRPHKDTLPVVKAGDVVLLRNFTVVSLHNKGFGLRTNDESSWAVFDHEDQPAQIRGPPVEYGEKETTYVADMRTWFGLLDEKGRTNLERANKKIVDAGKTK